MKRNPKSNLEETEIINISTKMEVEIPFLCILMEAQLEESKWIKQRYEQLSLIDKKTVKCRLPWTMLSKANGSCLQQEGQTSPISRKE